MNPEPTPEQTEAQVVQPLGKPHVASVVAVAAGVLGLLVLPIVFGPASIIAGVIGLVKSQEEGRNSGLAVVGMILGLVDIIAMFVVMSAALSMY